MAAVPALDNVTEESNASTLTPVGTVNVYKTAVVDWVVDVTSAMADAHKNALPVCVN